MYDLLIEKFWISITDGSIIQLALVLSIALSMLVQKLIKDFIGELVGIYQFLIVSALGVLITVGLSYLQGGSLFDALTNASSVAAYQVFIHQAIKQVKKYNQDVEEIKSHSVKNLSNDYNNSDLSHDIDSSRL